jgi:hypothetical protein
MAYPVPIAEVLRKQEEARMSGPRVQNYAVDGLGRIRVLNASLATPSPETIIMHSWVFQLTDESIQVLSINPKRAYAMIQNPSVTDIVVNFDGLAIPAQGFTIAAGGFYEPLYGFSSQIQARMVTVGATGSIVIIEGVRR